MQESADRADGVAARVSVVQLGPEYFAMPDPYQTPAMLVGLGCVLGSVWLVGVHGFPGQTQCLVGLGIVVAASQFGLWRLRRRARRRIRAIVSEQVDAPIEAVVAAIKEDRRTWGARGDFATIQREMMRRGGEPKVVVFQRYGCIWEPRGDVIRAGFEPRRLDEKDEGFRSLQAAVERNDEPRSVEKAGAGSWIIHRSLRLGRFLRGRDKRLAPLFYAVLSLWLLRDFFKPTTYPQLAICVAIATAVIWSLLDLGSRQIFVVPAGLLVRHCGTFSRRWSRRLFNAGRSALWLEPEEEEMISILVGNEQTCVEFSATQAEAELLVRAWVSPLRPPSLEQLVDLT